MQEKPLILLLHGLWHTSSAWQQIAHLFEQAGFDTYAPDWLIDSKADFAQATANIMNHTSCINRTAIHLVGHSFGGACAHYLLHHTPHIFASVTHISSVIPNEGKSFLDTIPADFANNITRFYRGTKSHLPYVIWRTQFINNHFHAHALYKQHIVPVDKEVLSMRLPSSQVCAPNIPVDYITLADDATLPQPHWHSMAHKAGATTRITLAGSHEALLTHADAIAHTVLTAQHLS